jgi:outer membrane protein TolC
MERQPLGGDAGSGLKGGVRVGSGFWTVERRSLLFAALIGATNYVVDRAIDWVFDRGNGPLSIDQVKDVTLALLTATLVFIVMRRYFAFREASEATRRRAQEELEQAQGLLEQRICERTAQLEAANEALQAEIDVRTRAEQAVREARDLLEKRVEERTAQLALAN